MQGYPQSTLLAVAASRTKRQRRAHAFIRADIKVPTVYALLGHNKVRMRVQRISRLLRTHTAFFTMRICLSLLLSPFGASTFSTLFFSSRFPLPVFVSLSAPSPFCSLSSIRPFSISSLRFCVFLSTRFRRRSFPPSRFCRFCNVFRKASSAD